MRYVDCVKRHPFFLNGDEMALGTQRPMHRVPECMVFAVKKKTRGVSRGCGRSVTSWPPVMFNGCKAVLVGPSSLLKSFLRLLCVPLKKEDTYDDYHVGNQDFCPLKFQLNSVDWTKK